MYTTSIPVIQYRRPWLMREKGYLLSWGAPCLVATSIFDVPGFGPALPAHTTATADAAATHYLRQSKQPAGLRIPVADDLQEMEMAMVPKRQRRLTSPRSVHFTRVKQQATTSLHLLERPRPGQQLKLQGFLAWRFAPPLASLKRFPRLMKDKCRCVFPGFRLSRKRKCDWLSKSPRSGNYSLVGPWVCLSTPYSHPYSRSVGRGANIPVKKMHFPRYGDTYNFVLFYLFTCVIRTDICRQPPCVTCDGRGYRRSICM